MSNTDIEEDNNIDENVKQALNELNYEDIEDNLNNEIEKILVDVYNWHLTKSFKEEEVAKYEKDVIKYKYNILIYRFVFIQSIYVDSSIYIFYGYFLRKFHL